MAGLLGAFVLVLVGVLVVQMDLVASLQAETEKRQQRGAAPHRAGKGAGDPARDRPRDRERRAHRHQRQRAVRRSTPTELRPEGRQLLQSLVHPLRVYLGERNELLMVSGFTDDKPVSRRATGSFADNLELSAQRALTVTRALIDEGMPSSQVFAAAFGAEQPVASNANEQGRALNRRVEMAPVPRTAPAAKVGANG